MADKTAEAVDIVVRKCTSGSAHDDGTRVNSGTDAAAICYPLFRLDLHDKRRPSFALHLT